VPNEWRSLAIKLLADLNALTEQEEFKTLKVQSIKE